MFARLTPEQKFWTWFTKNLPQLETVQTGREPILAELNTQLKRVHKDLVFEMGLGEKGQREFIVSANGIKSTVPHVERLAGSAPPISGWRVIQFRPRKDGVDLVLNDKKFSKDSIFYTAQEVNSVLNLWLYIDGLTSANTREYMGACFIFLDTVIGEYDVMTRIGQIEFLPLIEADGRQRPLRELANAVDDMKSKTGHNPSS